MKFQTDRQINEMKIDTKFQLTVKRKIEINFLVFAQQFLATSFDFGCFGSRISRMLQLAKTIGKRDTATPMFYLTILANSPTKLWCLAVC